MKTSMFCNPAKVYVVCVDSYDKKVLVGRIYNALNDFSIAFNSTIDMISKMETLLDESKQLQSYAVKRAFVPGPAGGALVPSGSVDKGELATFSLKLLFRQNASWQGAIFWREGDAEETFRSVLELLLLMDNALSARCV